MPSAVADGGEVIRMLGYHPFYFWSLATLASIGAVVISWIHKQFEWPYVLWAAFNLVIAYALFMAC